MINLIRSEWVKLRSVRSTLITLVLAGGLMVLVAVLSARNANARGDAINLSGLTGGVTAAVFIFGTLGVQIIGQEYRFNTIRPTFTAVPRRLQVLVAKLIVITVAVGVTSAAMVGFCYLIGTTMVDQFIVDGIDHRIMYGIVLFSMIWAAFGLGIGAIVRQPIAGILIMVGEAFVAENLISALFPKTMKWMPFNNGIQMTLRVDEMSNMQGMLAGGIYFAAIAAALVAIGMVLANRRDA